MDRKKQIVFLGIWGATFMAMFGETIPQSFTPLFLAGLGITPAMVGIVYNIRNVIQSFLRVFAGSLSDVFGRKRLILLGLVFITLVPFIYSASSDMWLPIIAMTVSGIGVSIYFPPSEAYASSLYPPEQAGTAMGRFHMSWAVSSIIGPSVGGFLAVAFPGYRTLFLVAGLVTGTSLIVFNLLTRGDEDSGNGKKSPEEVNRMIREVPSTMRRMLKNRRVAAGSVAVFAHAFCHWAIPTYLPLYAYKLGFNEAAIGLSLTANALIMAVGLPVIGSLSDRIGRYTPIVVGLFASVVVFAAFPSVSSPTVMVALMALLGCCAVLEFPASQAVTMEALPAGERGMATGVWGMMMSLGGTLGMFALSYVVGVAPIEWFFYACAGFSLAGGVLLFLIRGWFKA